MAQAKAAWAQSSGALQETAVVYYDRDEPYHRITVEIGGRIVPLEALDEVMSRRFGKVILVYKYWYNAREWREEVYELSGVTPREALDVFARRAARPVAVRLCAVRRGREACRDARPAA